MPVEPGYLPHFSYTFYAPAAKYSETIAFYRDVLGFSVVGGFGGPDEDSEGVFIGAARGLIEVISDREESAFKEGLLQGRSYTPPIGGALVIQVPDVEALRRRLAGLNVPVLQELRDWPWRIRDFKVQDPCGNLIGPFSRKASARFL